MSEPRSHSYSRTYQIEFKDGTSQVLHGLDISIPAAGEIHSTSTQEVLISCNFLAFRTRDGRDTVLIAADTIKSIHVVNNNKTPGEFLKKYQEAAQC